MFQKLRERSADEIRFRARQEIGSAYLALRPPQLEPGQTKRTALLPDASAMLDRVRRSGFGDELIRRAEEVLAGKYSLLGYQIELPSPPPWRRDFIHGQQSELKYFRRVPYLNFAVAGDHKVIWELNRHQHLVLLAQAWCVSQRAEFLQSIQAQLENWLTENPFHQGINWTSALEVGVRALSWIWIDHLAGDQFPASFRQRWITSLYQHGRHLELNLSTYFSPNTHLQGEAVALHAIGALYPEMPHAAAWTAVGRATLDAELAKQVRADGAHFEQSTYYHVYATDFFLLHYLLAGRPAHFQPTLVKMAEYLHAVMGPARRLPFLGDDDGGRLFHPYGAHDQYGRATLATCSRLFGRPDWLASADDLMPQAAWWLGESAFGSSTGYAKPHSQVFSEAGVAVLSRGRFWLTFDAGPFGPFGGGHSHADTLSVVVRVGDTDILIDPATFTYLADPAARNRFRGTAAHNTMRIDGRDQAQPVSPFAWQSPPQVRILAAQTAPGGDLVTAECLAHGVRHTRTVKLEDSRLLITDAVELPPGEHLVEQFWHPGLPAVPFAPTCYRIGPYAEITFRTSGSTVSYEQGGEYGWRSRAYGVKEEAPLITVSWRGSGRAEFETEITLA